MFTAFCTQNGIASKMRRGWVIFSPWNDLACMLYARIVTGQDIHKMEQLSFRKLRTKIRRL
jgi:hypothetical protein